MTYYKGEFYYTSDLKYKNFAKCIGMTKYTFSVDSKDDIELNDIGYKIPKLYKKDVYDALKIKDYKFRQELLNSFNKTFESEISNIISDTISSSDYEIIYEIVKDTNGNLFGKELHTGLLFPILSKSNLNIDYKITTLKDKDNCNRIYLKGTEILNFNSLYKCEIIMIGNQIANQNEIDEYKNRFNKWFFKTNKKKKYQAFIKYLYNKNVFKESFMLENEEKKVVELEKENIETSLMEEIEYNLIKLKGIDENLYLEYKTKYQNLINSFINKENLALLLGEIEFSFIFNKQGIDDILEIINKLKYEYLDNFINNSNNKINLDIKKLDKINELFLKVKNKYDFKSQRSILNNLAFLYLMEVIRNIDTIDINDLNNSYFISHLKSIIIWIRLLIDYDIIECSYIISLRDEVSLNIIMDIIKNVKFKNIDKDKIKKIGELYGY